MIIKLLCDTTGKIEILNMILTGFSMRALKSTFTSLGHTCHVWIKVYELSLNDLQELFYIPLILYLLYSHVKNKY